METEKAIFVMELIEIDGKSRVAVDYQNMSLTDIIGAFEVWKTLQIIAIEKERKEKLSNINAEVSG